ncbi:MAG: Holliday junction resolvase RuvX [Armatimonadota bacterium]|nr:Holliday junction resolvase RuvX [Armatimonadota bacterium]
MVSEAERTILAIDPGRSKCGLAIVRHGRESSKPPEVVHRAVLPVEDLLMYLTELADQYGADEVVIGNGTNSAQIAAAAQKAGLTVAVLDEKQTTVEARKRFFEDNPRRGWRRLIPTSLQTPWRPFDDYVAVILAERYLQRGDDP